MKNLKTILGVTIIASLVIIGCGENSNNTNELEQQNGELTKEKSLQEKDTNNLGVISNEAPEKEAGQENIKSPSETKTLTMIFEDYSEGDFPHLLFKDISSNEEYDFRFLSDNNLTGLPILLKDNDAAFGFKANPKYLNKTCIVETKKKSVMDSELNGETFKSMEWVITSIKLK
jgi:hypothetical protein